MNFFLKKIVIPTWAVVLIAIAFTVIGYIGNFSTKNEVAQGLSSQNEKKISSSELQIQNNSITKVQVGTINNENINIMDLLDREITEQLQNLYGNISFKFQRKHAENQKIESNIEITEDEIRKFYVDNNLESQVKFENVKDKIEEYLKRQQEQDLIYKNYQKSLEEGHVSFNLEKIPLWKTEITIGEAFTHDKKTSGVMLLEFSDYQCPFCLRNQEAVEQLIKQYPKVNFVYKHLPLPIHKEATQAALGAECAREQGQFIPYHKKLFENQRKQYIADLEKYAQEINIADYSLFQECLKTKKYQYLIDSDLKQAQMLNITGTPTYIIGDYNLQNDTLVGEIVTGALPKKDIENIILQYLK